MGIESSHGIVGVGAKENPGTDGFSVTNRTDKQRENLDGLPGHVHTLWLGGHYKFNRYVSIGSLGLKVVGFY